ncbi:hypothetical protein CDV31_016937 [Fusarium ambrosium]|uniref:Uncharacterized protein n=1 Tax=Fusarium ambrosium TaxID=131363 RepID=A0A428RY45_9HYPO|nr:hypothetical protein CDV31_016937 [Fusarium ambrosium]
MQRELHVGKIGPQKPVTGQPIPPYWACRLCDAKGQPEFFAAAATSSAADHLRKSHRIFESSQGTDTDPSTEESDRPKRRRLQYSTVPRARVKVIRELSLGLLINTNAPFSFFNDAFFQQLAWRLDPHLPCSTHLPVIPTCR